MRKPAANVTGSMQAMTRQISQKRIVLRCHMAFSCAALRRLNSRSSKTTIDAVIANAVLGYWGLHLGDRCALRQYLKFIARVFPESPQATECSRLAMSIGRITYSAV